MSAPLILGTNSIKDTGYEVANSLRFNDGSSDSLTQTFSSSGNRKTWTLSLWFKLGLIPPNSSRLFSIGNDASNTILSIFFTSGDLRFENVVSGSQTLDFRTDQVFRDPSAWSNLIIAVDTTQSTSSDRVKIYHNGSQITSFSTETYPSQNSDTLWNHTTGSATIGSRAASASGTYFDGYMAEVVNIDGSQLDATSFGEFDEDSGIWKPIDVSGLTFGTNGFYLDFEDSSALGNDVSGNDNDFTVNNLTSIDQTTDTCTNNFATWNPIDGKTSSSTFSEGNLKTVSANSPNICGTSTFGLSQGKWYYEIKLTTEAVAGEAFMGVGGDMETNTDSDPRNEIPYYAIRNQSGIIQTGVSQSTSQHPDFSAGDIIGFGLDLDNNRLYISKNGSWWDSTTTFSGSTPTNYISLGTGFSHWRVMVANVGGASAQETYEANFGNPPYSITSGNSDAEGYGNFEYSVPSGYYALNTKNLAEYG